MQRIIFLTIITGVLSDAVCDKGTLISEIKQDLLDNNRLDCKRKIPRPHGLKETILEKNRRLAARWDSDCSFESNNNWVSLMSQHLKITNLVSADGDILEQDLDDEADMCEFVRSALAADKFPGHNDLQHIDPSFLTMLSCPGAEKQSQVCAVTEQPFFNENGWFIFFQGIGITYDNNPIYDITKKKPKEEEKKEDEKDVEENDEERRKRIEISQFTKIFDSYRQKDEKQDNKQGKLSVTTTDTFKTVETIGLAQTQVAQSNVVAILKAQLGQIDENLLNCGLQLIAQAEVQKPIAETDRTKEKNNFYLSLTDYTVNPNVAQSFQVEGQLKCANKNRFKHEDDQSEFRFLFLMIPEFYKVINVKSDENLLSQITGEFKSQQWKDSGVEFVYKPKDLKMELTSEKDEYFEQPLLYLYQFAGKASGRLSFYILEQLLGSKQPQDCFPKVLSYSVGFAEEFLSLNGYAIGAYHQDDSLTKQYVSKLKWWYIGINYQFSQLQGKYNFRENPPQAKMSIVFLPYLYLHQKAEFQTWNYLHEKTNALYHAKLGEFQDIFGMQKMISLDPSDLAAKFTHDKPDALNFILIYNIVFKAPEKLPPIAFRIMYEGLGQPWTYFPGTMYVSSRLGNKRSVNGIGLMTSKLSQIQIKIQACFLGQDQMYKNLFDEKAGFFYIKPPLKEIVREDYQDFTQFETAKIGKPLGRVEIFATAAKSI